VAGGRLPLITQEAASKARHLLSAFVLDATGMYRVGGFLAILLGATASIVASRIRRPVR
jgi:hypothetical protein